MPRWIDKPAEPSPWTWLNLVKCRVEIEADFLELFGVDLRGPLAEWQDWAWYLDRLWYGVVNRPGRLHEYEVHKGDRVWGPFRVMMPTTRTVAEIMPPRFMTADDV